jgi:hypothetical protein
MLASNGPTRSRWVIQPSGNSTWCEIELACAAPIFGLVTVAADADREEGFVTDAKAARS